jgi:hypothetical protein
LSGSNRDNSFLATWAAPSLFFADEALNNEEAHLTASDYFFKIMITHVENCGFSEVFNFTAFPTPISVPFKRMLELFGAPTKEYFCLAAEFEDGQNEGLIFAVVMPINKDSSVWNIQAHTKNGAEMMAEYINSVK